MKIFLATDHAGFDLKEELKTWLKALGFEVGDEGAFNYDENDDYPDFIRLAALEVSSSPGSRGIILGGSGQGEAMIANRFPGIRAVVYYGGPSEIVSLSRKHNDANILSLGARFITIGEAKSAVELWLKTEFSNEARHNRRIKKIDHRQEEILEL